MATNRRTETRRQLATALEATTAQSSTCAGSGTELVNPVTLGSTTFASCATCGREFGGMVRATNHTARQA